MSILSTEASDWPLDPNRMIGETEAAGFEVSTATP